VGVKMMGGKKQAYLSTAKKREMLYFFPIYLGSLLFFPLERWLLIFFPFSGIPFSPYSIDTGYSFFSIAFYSSM